MHGLITRQNNIVEQSHFGASIGNTEITDLVSTDDAVVLEVLAMARQALHEEEKPLELKVS